MENCGLWNVESVIDNWLMEIRTLNVVASRQSKFYNIKVHDLAVIGKTLFVDGCMQSTENDEFILSECIVHPSCLLHKNPENVFILGGASGGVIKEILKYKSVKRCVVAEVDGELVEICKEYLWSSTLHPEEDEKRLEARIEDPKKVLETFQDGVFDVIIVDVCKTSEDKPSSEYYTEDTFKLCKKKLSRNGILAGRADPYSIKKVFTRIHRSLKEVFKNVRPYAALVPSLQYWGWCLSFKNLNGCNLEDNNKDLRTKEKMIDKMIEERLIGGEKSLKFYDGETHGRIFRLRKNIRKILDDDDEEEEEARVIT